MSNCGKIKVDRIYNVGVNPANLAVTPDSRYGYVTNANNYEIKNEDSVTVLDLEEGVPKLTIHDESFVEPYRAAIDSRGKYCYVCNSGSPKTKEEKGTVSIIDIRNNIVVGLIEGFDGPGGIAISKNTAYVTNYGADGGLISGNGRTVSVVDLKLRQIISTIIVDQAPAALVLSPCHKWLYVVCYVNGLPGTGKLNIISTRTNSVINSISGFFGPFGVDVTKDGKLLYISNFGSNDFAPFGSSVSVVDLRKNLIVKNIETGIQPSGLAISSKYVYVSNYNVLYAKANFLNLTPGEGTVNVISLKTNNVINTVSVGQSPATITLSPDEKKLFVCKYVQNTVAELFL